MLPETRETFSKSARLRKRSEFLRLSRIGKKVHSPNFVVIYESNERGESRLGITVSGKVGNAVVRNQIKRLVREFFRRRRQELLQDLDILVIAKKKRSRHFFGPNRNRTRKELGIPKSSASIEMLSLRDLLTLSLAAYHKFLSPLMPRACRFYPTCSEYALESIQKYGILKGISLGVLRISRCHPWNPGGYDPVRKT